MASKDATDAPSATSSSFLASLPFTSRRNSVSSLSSLTPQHKEAFTQALNQIHSTASRSAELTTFNDFATPPSSSSDDRRRSGNNNQGGLGGLYNRFRASVGASTTQSTSPPLPRPKSGESPGRPWSRSSRPPPLNKQDLSAPSPNLSSPTLRVTSPRLKDSSSITSSSNLPLATADGTHSRLSLSSAISKSTEEGTDAYHSRNISSSEIVPRIPLEGHESELLCSFESGHALRSPRLLPPSARLEAEDEANAGSSRRLSANMSDSTRGTNLSIKIATYANDTDATNITHKLEHESESGAMHSALLQSTDALLVPNMHHSSERAGLAALAPRTAAVSDKSSSYPSTIAHPSDFNQTSVSRSNTTHLGKRPGNISNGKNSVAQMHRKILDREFWMKDENAKVCFNCGDSFSTFHRKHHCSEFASLLIICSHSCVVCLLMQ